MLSDEIGPYRIEEQLGVGGMGEVYRAYDSRLDRRVALKVVLSDSLEKPQARERFRREARAAARLSHPAIVQIHDIVERDEGDCIVMELVEGRTLSDLLGEGPFDVPRAVRLARQIAEGLAAAHAEGVVHRDLKAGNVMITADDHAKILDFGLAKRVADTEGEVTLSVEGKILGTGYAMSPEQAQGFTVDHRSDLFSLGSLLYEMVTGKAPFRRRNLAETLTWVCVHQQPPARRVNPAVPQALSDLIDRMLEKEPDHRPQDAADLAAALRNLETAGSSADRTMLDLPRPAQEALSEASRSISRIGPPASQSIDLFPIARSPRRRWWPAAAAAAAGLVLAAAVVLYLALRPPTPEAILVAVPAARVGAGDALGESELLASGVRVALLQGLLSLKGVTALAPDQVDAVSGTSVEMARALAADEVVTSRLECTADGCQVTLERVLGSNGALTWTGKVAVSADDLLHTATLMGNQIRLAYDEYPLRAGSGRLEVRSEDYVEYIRIRETFFTRPEGVTLETLLDRLDDVRHTSPRFVPAYLLEAHIGRVRFVESRAEEDLERAFQAVATARQIAPRDPQPLFSLVDVALDGDRLEVAETALDDLETLAPDEPQIQAQRAVVLERYGRVDEALKQLRAAVSLRPSVKNLLDLANMEQRHGEIEAAKMHLDELLRLAPGDVRAQSLLALIELLNGSPQRAAELYREIVARSPDYGSLNNLGLAYLLLERYEAAAEQFRLCVERQPTNLFAVLNLADAEFLVGRRAEAESLYRQVLDLAETDPLGDDWEILDTRAQAHAHLGESRQAAALIQQALQTAPGNSQIAFNAALVYTVIGDTSSAMVNAERALQLGYDPRWFGFPWFDPLRSDPEFQALLDEAR